jgi:hypothetical protein
MIIRFFAGNFQKISIFLAILGFCNQGIAQKTWDRGANTNNWGDANNWNPNILPTSSETVVIASGQTVTVNIPDAACATLKLAPTTNGTASLNFNSGSVLTVSGLVTLGGGTTGQLGSIIMTNGGTLICNGFTLANTGSNVFTPGTGTVNLTATNTLPSSLFGSFNNLSVSAGTTSMASAVAVGGIINLASGAKLSILSNTLTLNGTVTGTGTLVGSSTSDVTIGGTGALGSLYFDQTTIGTTNEIRNFSINRTASGTVTLGNPLNITTGTGGSTFGNSGNITITNGVLNTGGFLTLESSALGYGYVTKGNAAGGYINGNVTVERYIPAWSNHRAWRFLGIPITSSSTQTINAAWQEGQAANVIPAAPYQNYGTLITGPAGTTGMDVATNGHSMIKYNPTTNGWDNITSTTGPIAANSCYMLYVRGDRSIPINANSQTITSPTTLRTTGTLNQGDQAAISVAPSKFAAVGNPFPTALDFTLIAAADRSNINQFFWLWDSQLNTLGGYQLFSPANSYKAVPGGGSYGTRQWSYIESGQAFFVQAANGATGSLTLREAYKTGGSTNMGFTPTTLPEEMRVSLFKVNADLSTSLLDGASSIYSSTGADMVNDDDAAKINNFTENFCILRNNTNLMMESRPVITENDTTFYTMWWLNQGNYQLEFAPSQLAHPGLGAWLQDAYLNTTTMISLTDSTTTINFSITSDAASASMNRFRLVYGPLSPLPVKFTGIKAFQQSNDIAVSWKVENQVNISGYEVEKSTDGRNFTKVAAQKAIGSLDLTVSYNWLDVNAAPGDNFYRIKSIGIGGDISYSIIVKVKTGTGNPAITVYPNPVTGSVVTLQFVNMPKGNYTLTLTNGLGQALQTSQVNHSGANAAQSFSIDRRLAKGNYQLQIIKPSGKKEVIKLVIADGL